MTGSLAEDPEKEFEPVLTATKIPVLVVFGTDGPEADVTARQYLADTLTGAGGEGQVETVPLAKVNGDMRLVVGDAEIRDQICPGFKRALSRWLPSLLH